VYGPWAIGATAADNAAGLCVEVVFASGTSRVVAFDDVEILATTCAAGFFNNGTARAPLAPPAPRAWAAQ
jgi:hypothetical protein